MYRDAEIDLSQKIEVKNNQCYGKGNPDNGAQKQKVDV